MAKQEILLTVMSQKGECKFKHVVGQEIIFDGKLPDICPALWHSLYPTLRVLWFGGNFPWEKEGEGHVACTDHVNPVVMKIQRRTRD